MQQNNINLIITVDDVIDSAKNIKLNFEDINKNNLNEIESSSLLNHAKKGELTFANKHTYTDKYNSTILGMLVKALSFEIKKQLEYHSLDQALLGRTLKLLEPNKVQNFLTENIEKVEKALNIKFGDIYLAELTLEAFKWENDIRGAIRQREAILKENQEGVKFHAKRMKIKDWEKRYETDFNELALEIKGRLENEQKSQHQIYKKG